MTASEQMSIMSQCLVQLSPLTCTQVTGHLSTLDDLE
jgi:hypothetical protein